MVFQERFKNFLKMQIWCNCSIKSNKGDLYEQEAGCCQYKQVQRLD